MILALLLLMAPLPSSDEAVLCTRLQSRYAEMDAESIRALHTRARTPHDRFLSLYRLVPLTLDYDVLEDIPEELGPEATARERALLAALWSFRIQDARIWNKIPYARRSAALLDQARAQDPNDPYVLLVEGQSLLFTPAIVGGDRREALARFRSLRAQLEREPACGLPLIEVDTWIWLALKKLRDDSADDLYRQILARNPPRFYRAFLQDPP